MTDDEIISAIKRRRDRQETRIDMKTIRIPELFSPALGDAVRQTERRLGIVIPPFLSRIYIEVGNGGFGPGCGMLGLAEGYTDAEGRTMPERYLFLLPQGWPQNVIPLFDWGCGVWSCVDAAGETGDVVTMDESGPTVTTFDIKSWFMSWAMGIVLFDQIYERASATIINPFTGHRMPVSRLGRAKGRRGLTR